MTNFDPAAQFKAQQAQTQKLLQEQIASIKDTSQIVQQSKAAYNGLAALNQQLKAINAQDSFQKTAEVLKETQPPKGFFKKLFKG